MSLRQKNITIEARIELITTFDIPWFPSIGAQVSFVFCVVFLFFSLRKRKNLLRRRSCKYFIYEYYINLKVYPMSIICFRCLSLCSVWISLPFAFIRVQSCALDYYSLRALNQTYIGAKRES